MVDVSPVSPLRPALHASLGTPVLLIAEPLDEHCPHDTALALRKAAMLDLLALPGDEHALMFRIGSAGNELAKNLIGDTLELCHELQLLPKRLYFALADGTDRLGTDLESMFAAHRKHGFRLGLDDFSRGHSALRHITMLEPDIIMVERMLPGPIYSDQRRKALLSAVVDLGHLMGAQVVFDGVQDEIEFLACRECVMDYVAGPWIGTNVDPEATEQSAAYIRDLSVKDRRRRGNDKNLIQENILLLPPIRIDARMEDLFEAFRRDKDRNLFPLVDEIGRPLGIVLERDLKEYTYSRYGRELIQNRSIGLAPKQFIREVPTAEVSFPAEKILRIFTLGSSTEGMVMTERGQYVGYLDPTALLRIINDKNIAIARDQNPLTRLPGNHAIDAECLDLLNQQAETRHLAYFDFDHFKPFNDLYGFRQGDRAIQIFADLLRQHFANDFIGHIGGDDFFASNRNCADHEFEDRVLRLIEDFRHDVLPLYSEEAREKGGIEGVDRDGNKRFFPCLGCSVAIVHLPRHQSDHSMDRIANILADLKKKAKVAPNHIATWCFEGG